METGQIDWVFFRLRLGVARVAGSRVYSSGNRSIAHLCNIYWDQYRGLLRKTP